MLEKQRSRNNLVLLAGGIVAASGILSIVLGHRVAGAVLLSVGVAIAMIAYSISTFFFRMDMASMVKDNKRK